MSDASFRKLGGAASILLAVCGVLYALLLLLDTSGSGLATRLLEATTSRGLNLTASLTLAVSGLLLMVGATAVTGWLEGVDRQWLRWAAGTGIVAGAMTAAHGYWDYVRVPVLLGQWDTGSEVRQAAISTFAGVANPVNPRGLGTLLLTGLFVLVVSQTIYSRRDSRQWIGLIGLLYGALLLVAFVLGMVGPGSYRALFTGLAVGVAGPVWWLLLGWQLLRKPAVE